MNTKEKKQKMPLHKYFQDVWLLIKDIKGCLRRDKNDNPSARCCTCNNTIELCTSGKGAILDHAEGEKHKKAVERRTMFFNKPSENSSPVEITEQEPSCSKQQTLHGLTNVDVLKSEIIWLIKCITSGFSNRSCDQMNDVVACMFPDSNIAKSFAMGRTKAMYMTNYGLLPYFKSMLLESVRKSVLVFSFDESLNEVTQTCEMDVYLRYWDTEANRVTVRYWGSSFFGHGRATDILQQFKDITNELNLSHLFQISMDGPNTNWKFYNDYSAERSQTTYHKLIDIGSCSLHVVHGSFKSGSDDSGWGLKNILKHGFVILHDTPARRDDYTAVTGCQKFPLPFCATRWVENKRVCDRLIEIWDNIIKIVGFWSKLPKSKQPSSKSYVSVKENVGDH